MFFSDGNKERRRFYLLPGQGGPSARRKHRKFLTWSIVASLIFSALMALLMYWFNRVKPF
jgi:hypothetical protein